MLDVALVGTGGMMPLPNRFTSSALIRIEGRLILVDCGEGAQVSLKMLGWGFKNIDVICITHFHGDHILGITGLLLTMGNSGRVEPIHIIGPKGLEKIVESLLIVTTDLPFEIKFTEVAHEFGKAIYFDVLLVKGGESVRIGMLPAVHKIPCFSYSFELRRCGKFDVEKAKELELPVKTWGILQKGENVEINGKIFTPQMVLGENRKSILLSYITDSRPPNGFTEFAKCSDLLICEGLYGDNEKIEKAIERGHMTFIEAAHMAKNAKVKEMWLTHFSPSLAKPEEYIGNATEIFENSVVGEDRMWKKISFED